MDWLDNGWIGGWMYGWWMNGWMNRRMDKWLDRWIYGYIIYIYGYMMMDGWTNKWMTRWMNGLMDIHLALHSSGWWWVDSLNRWVLLAWWIGWWEQDRDKPWFWQHQTAALLPQWHHSPKQRPCEEPPEAGLYLPLSGGDETVLVEIYGSTETAAFLSSKSLVIWKYIFWVFLNQLWFRGLPDSLQTESATESEPFRIRSSNTLLSPKNMSLTGIIIVVKQEHMTTMAVTHFL